MKPGKLAAQGEQRRDQVEDALALIWRTNRDLSEVALRLEQAMRRTPLVHDVLNPALTRVIETRERLATARQVLGTYWSDEQNRRWRVSKE